MKFKVGDLISDNYIVYKVVDVTDKEYVLETLQLRSDILFSAATYKTKIHRHQHDISEKICHPYDINSEKISYIECRECNEKIYNNNSIYDYFGQPFCSTECIESYTDITESIADFDDPIWQIGNNYEIKKDDKYIDLDKHKNKWERD